MKILVKLTKNPFLTNHFCFKILDLILTGSAILVEVFASFKRFSSYYLTLNTANTLFGDLEQVNRICFVGQRDLTTIYCEEAVS